MTSPRFRIFVRRGRGWPLEGHSMDKSAQPLEIPVRQMRLRKIFRAHSAFIPHGVSSSTHSGCGSSTTIK